MMRFCQSSNHILAESQTSVIPNKKIKRKAPTDELSLLCGIYDQEASEENGTWLFDLLLPNVPAYLS